MRKMICRLIPGLLLVSLLGSSAMAQQMRIATVDMRKVFDNYWKTKKARVQLEERKADMTKEYNNMVNDWKRVKDEYQTTLASASDQAVSADERDKRKKQAEDKLKEIRDAEQNLTDYERRARTTYEEQVRRMHDNVLAEIRTVVEAKAKAGNYALVLDTAGESFNGTPIVLYTNNESDLTQTVLDQLNATAPAETTKPATPDKDAPKSEDKKK